MRKRLENVWHSILNWIEGGDLVPLLVVVSAVHYAAVLRTRDIWPVAVAIGLLVDVGHFRSVLIAVRYGGADRAERALRYGVAAVMTGISLSYHWRFYGGDWTFALPMPLLIAALAYFDNRDRYKRRSMPATACSTAQGCGEEAQPAPTPALACPHCGATSGKDGKPFRKMVQVSAHMRWCRSERAHV